MNIQEYKEIRKEQGKQAGKALLFFFVFLPFCFAVLMTFLVA